MFSLILNMCRGKIYYGEFNEKATCVNVTMEMH